MWALGHCGSGFVVFNARARTPGHIAWRLVRCACVLANKYRMTSRHLQAAVRLCVRQIAALFGGGLT